LPERIGSALGMVTDSARALHDANRELFALGLPRFDFVSPLAEGADQIAAEVALEYGYRLHAVLPFKRDDYRIDMAGEAAAAQFDNLRGRAPTWRELPGDRSNEPEAYAMAGRGTVAHCDILIAVWDGLKARGRGGTAEVVETAIARGTPV